MVLSILLAETSGIDISDPSVIGSLGVGGLFVVAFIRGWIVPGYILDRAEQRIAEQAARIDKLTTVFESDMIPALSKSTEANEKMYDYLASLPPPSPRTRNRKSE